MGHIIQLWLIPFDNRQVYFGKFDRLQKVVREFSLSCNRFTVGRFALKFISSRWKTCKELRPCLLALFRLELDLPPDLPEVASDRGQLQQVFLNLLINAAEAMPDGWIITIRAEAAAGASELFHLTGSKAEDIDVVMTVDEVDVEKQRRALDCYVTYRETIERAGARRNIPREAVFEIYQEAYDPPLGSLFEGLSGTE